jgi:beta-galactosidase
VAVGAVETPQFSSWRPILQCGSDLARSPLMELDYGAGRAFWCSLRLEDCWGADPAAERLARQAIRYARTCDLAPKARGTIYLGDAAGRKLLTGMGLVHRADSPPDDWRADDLLVIGPKGGAGAANEAARARTEQLVRAGGKAFFLSGAEVGYLSLTAAGPFSGAVEVPDWPECRGLAPSDFRWASGQRLAVFTGRCETGAGGLLARKQVGRGVHVHCAIGPDMLKAGDDEAARAAGGRAARVIAQVLANMGATFAADARIFQPLRPAGAASASSRGTTGG